MACTPFNYTNYDTGNASCTGHRDACSGNRTLSVSVALGSSGQTIYASDVENLRANIINEIAVWNNWNANNGQGQYTINNRGTISQGQTIDHVDIVNLSLDLAAIQNYTSSNGSITNNGTWSNPGQSGLAGGNTVTGPQWAAIVNSYNTIRQDCVCNSDCHCNTVCSCYGNCGCNYSDERLKENIKLIDTRGDLNVYSYTYLWDKTKTFMGVIAQELLGTKYESALGKDSNGFYFVDYSQLPVKFKEV